MSDLICKYQSNIQEKFEVIRLISGVGEKNVPSLSGTLEAKPSSSNAMKITRRWLCVRTR